MKSDNMVQIAHLINRWTKSVMKFLVLISYRTYVVSVCRIKGTGENFWSGYHAERFLLSKPLKDRYYEVLIRSFCHLTACWSTLEPTPPLSAILSTLLRLEILPRLQLSEDQDTIRLHQCRWVKLSCKEKSKPAAKRPEVKLHYGPSCFRSLLLLWCFYLDHLHRRHPHCLHLHLHRYWRYCRRLWCCFFVRWHLFHWKLFCSHVKILLNWYTSLLLRWKFFIPINFWCSVSMMIVLLKKLILKIVVGWCKAKLVNFI